jgi:hypothetical protein
LSSDKSQNKKSLPSPSRTKENFKLNKRAEDVCLSDNHHSRSWEVLSLSILLTASLPFLVISQFLIEFHTPALLKVLALIKFRIILKGNLQFASLQARSRSVLGAGTNGLNTVAPAAFVEGGVHFAD